MLRRFHFPKSASRALLVSALLGLTPGLSGCGILPGTGATDKKIPAAYLGMADKSLAIVIYTDQATTNEFPAAREEISSFLAAQVREHLPTTRMLDYHEVINWQDDTLNWYSLTEKEMGKHFSVDRVLYIELLDYAVSPNRGYGDLQGHLRANCKVYAVDATSPEAAWSEVIDVSYPKDHPLEAVKMSPDAVRSHTLEDFAAEVVSRFYEHGEFTKALKDQP